MWNNVFIFVVVITMFFSGGLIPLYLVVKGVGLIDSLWATILPFAVNTFNLIIMRTAFMAVPESLEESAKMDGPITSSSYSALSSRSPCGYCCYDSLLCR